SAKVCATDARPWPQAAFMSVEESMACLRHGALHQGSPAEMTDDPMLDGSSQSRSANGAGRFGLVSDTSIPKVCTDMAVLQSDADESPSPTATQRLGAVTGILLIVASMIGTGVFTTTGFMVSAIPSPTAVLLAWLLGGVAALCGALTY